MKVKLIMVHTHHDYTDIIKTNYCVANVLYTQPENKYRTCLSFLKMLAKAFTLVIPKPKQKSV